MSIESIIFDRLSSDAELVGMVEAIRPTQPQENAPSPPQLVYTITQSEVTLFSGGASSLKRYALQLDCYGIDLRTCLSVLDRAKSILDGWSSGTVQWCKYETQLTSPTDPGHYAQHSYTVWANAGGNEPVVGEDFAELRACDHVLRLDCDGLTLDGEAVGSGGAGEQGPTGPTGPQGEPGPNEVTTSTETDLDGYLYGDGENINAVTPYDPESFGAVPYWRPGVGWTLISTEEASGSVLVFDTDGNHNWADPAGETPITTSTETDLNGVLIGDGSTVGVVTTSAGLAAVISDETGTGALVFGTSPTINTPTLVGVVNVSTPGTSFSGGNSTTVNIGLSGPYLYCSHGIGAVGYIESNSYLKGTTVRHPMVTPAAISGNQNNYNPGSVAKYYRVSTTGSTFDITGLAISQGDGQEVCFINIGTANINLKHENTFSTAGNRFWFADESDIVLVEGQSSGVLVYDATSQRWRKVAE